MLFRTTWEQRPNNIPDAQAADRSNSSFEAAQAKRGPASADGLALRRMRHGLTRPVLRTVRDHSRSASASLRVSDQAAPSDGKARLHPHGRAVPGRWRCLRCGPHIVGEAALHELRERRVSWPAPPGTRVGRPVRGMGSAMVVCHFAVNGAQLKGKSTRDNNLPMGWTRAATGLVPRVPQVPRVPRVPTCLKWVTGTLPCGSPSPN
jgi:hypothetical protein